MPESLNSSIEIHDSVLTLVETQAKQVKLSIEAYIHKAQAYLESIPARDGFRMSF